MDIEVMGEALRLVATTLSPPVLWLLVLLLFVEAKLYKRAGLDLLALGWLANILYLYNDTFAATTNVFGLQISQFVGANLSLATSVLFLAFAREATRGRKMAMYDAILAGMSVVVISIIVAQIRLGSWRSPFVQPAPGPLDSALLYTPLILFSAASIAAAAFALRSELRTTPGLARRLIAGAWLAYAVLQFAYYTKFSSNKIYIVCAFTLAWGAKLCIACGVFLLFKQDTEALQAQRVLEQSQARQQLAFSWFAHELKNPIHSLKFRAATINTRLVLKDYTRARVDAAKLLQTANVLASIIESVKLAAEPIDRRKLEFFSVNDVVSEALDQVKSALQVETHVIRTEFGKNVTVCAIRSALVQIFVNLFRNGLEACAELTEDDLRRTRHLKMYVETKRVQGVVRVRVVDFGAGIARDALASMFEPYYSTKDGINRGLGLWVVKTFVETFHGQLNVKSPIERVGRGSVFELSFPSAHGKDVAALEFFNSTQPLLEPAI
jgi:signal transduction histidine kinase